MPRTVNGDKEGNDGTVPPDLIKAVPAPVGAQVGLTPELGSGPRAK